MAAKGLNQDQLAAAGNLRPNTLSEALNKRQPKMDTVEAIAEGLGVPMWALFMDETEYGLMTDRLKQATKAAEEQKARDDLRAAIQQDIDVLVDSLMAKHSGQSVDHPAKKLPSPRLAHARPAKKGTK